MLYPPFFFFKLYVLKRNYLNGWGGFFTSVIGAFYYLRVIKLMYFDEPASAAPVEAGADFRAVLSANALLILVLGLFPGGLLALCARVIG